MGNTNLGDLVFREEVKAGLNVGYILPTLLPCPLQKPAIKCLMPALDRMSLGKSESRERRKFAPMCFCRWALAEGCFSSAVKSSTNSLLSFEQKEQNEFSIAVLRYE